jgi:two-component system, OmpR family, phosphate regulon sensor histidine kinase PhoR
LSRVRGRRLLWQLYPSYLLIVLVALTGVTWYFSSTLRGFYLEQARHDLEARARLVEQQVQGRLSVADPASIDQLVKRLGQSSGTRITVLRRSGEVLGDSAEEPGRMENHQDRPEVRTALAGGVGSATRFSQTLQREMVYVAIPVLEAGGLTGIVRAAVTVTAIDQALHALYLQVVLAGLATAVLAAGLSLLVSRHLSRPLEEMKRGAQRFARGELGGRLEISGSEETRELGAALNRMAAELDDRIRTVLQQRNEQDAVLASMVEGVLAVDSEERIIRLNQAAARFLGVQPESVQGRRIQEVVRKADLLRFVGRALQSAEAVEGDIVLRDAEERYLQAHGTLLRGEKGQVIGALIVLNDVTRLHRLENVRRDFVANVSHELKTPITAIKAAAETLLDGAAEDPDGARRFTGIIAKQADRLNAIIDDLLALSRIEQGDRESLPLARGALRPVLEAALLACGLSAQAKGVGINLFCAPELQARINAPLLEQAVVNLLTNAIKYSESGGKIVVDASQFQGRVTIKVQDWGCGIAAEHLPRLFERFYRADKARSRNLGGTGLGLAIVKHIVQAHGGEVIVHSTPGQGSVFTIALPAPS